VGTEAFSRYVRDIARPTAIMRIPARATFSPPSFPSLIALEGTLPEVKRNPFIADGGPKLILSGIAKQARIADDSCDRTT
jgi:hypothetical protein